MSRVRLLASFLMATLLVAGAASPAGAAKRKKTSKPPAKQPIYMVGNNWDGTADIIHARTFKSLQRFDVVPDRNERMAEIEADPDRMGYFLAIRQLVGEGHDQFVDDAFTSHDGRVVYVSRPSFADVVAIGLKRKRILWRTPVEGYRSDHMAISPDGSRLLVSASTARKVHVIDTRTGEIVANIESGDQPHESNFSRDGSRIFHASIGTVFTPTDEPMFDSTKGDRWFEIIDAKTYEVKERLDIGAILATYGYPGMSSAVRPMAISPDEKFAYFQLSFFHGFVEFDLVNKRPVRFANLPVAEAVQKMNRSEYLLDSAHHGLAMKPDGKKLCVAGTMSDYAAIVDRKTFAPTILAGGSKPYWATNSHDGKNCLMSFSGDDRVALISYKTGREVASVPVGDHPQRVREGVIRRSYLTKKR
jgi:DNA-binding beta-propeller fold protein YncE